MGTNPVFQFNSLLVVGVVRDAIVSSPDNDDRTLVYTSFWQLEPDQQAWPTLLARARTTPVGTYEPIQAAVQCGGREYASRMGTAEQWRAFIAREELLAIVSSGFAATGVLLAVVGLYGLISWVVGARTQEIAVRMAFGASPAQIVGLVASHAARLIAAGAVCGVLLAWAATTVLPAILGLPPVGRTWEPIALSIAVTAIAGALAVARLALRACRTDPIESLKAM